MSYYKKVILTAVLVLFASRPLFSENSGLRVHMVLDKKVYCSDEEINLKIFVKNRSAETNFFTVYDNSLHNTALYTTFQPVVFDRLGREIATTVPYRVENRQLKDILSDLPSRKIELGPSESFVYTVNLSRLYELAPGGKYRVRGYFFPDMEKNDTIQSDNELGFTVIRPRMEAVSEQKAVSRDVLPSETVLLMLSAEKKGQLDRCLKYIEIEKYISSFPNFVRIYNTGDIEERQRIGEDFKKYLCRERDDYLMDFRIVKEETDPVRSIAFVDVIADRFGVKYTNRFRYRFTLEKSDKSTLWLVTGLDAKIMKGKKK